LTAKWLTAEAAQLRATKAATSEAAELLTAESAHLWATEATAESSELLAAEAAAAETAEATAWVRWWHGDRHWHWLWTLRLLEGRANLDFSATSVTHCVICVLFFGKGLKTSW
jgi:hypothetical protein